MTFPVGDKSFAEQILLSLLRISSLILQSPKSV